MLLSYRWVTQIAGFAPGPKELADKLTFGGLEVDGLTRVGAQLERVVVGIVREKRPHPARPNLSCVVVDTGAGTVPVVCGAPNCPGPGSRVALAQVGARLGELDVAERELAHERSLGMLCSEKELGIGPDHEGIILLDGLTEAPAGTALVEALDLDDWIIDLSVTPNRPDALSHRGIAREMALLYGEKFAPPSPASTPLSGAPAAELAQVSVRDAEGCPRYTASVVVGVSIGQSRFADRYRLFNLGVRPINNAVDVTNLVMLEWGQPLHAFDLDVLAEKRIEVRRASPGETMRTLDDVERVFTADDLLICDGARPVAVAGIMGGLDTGVTEKTRNLLIECAYFDPKRVRRTAKRLKLQSESSYRFERGVDHGATALVLEAATSAMAAACGGNRAPGMLDCMAAPIAPRRVRFRPERYTAMMGYEAERSEMLRVFQGLGAHVEEDGAAFVVEAPTGRPDIEREIDFIEEIARVLGLARVPSKLPRIQSRVPNRREFDAARRAKETLAGLGLDEATCYSFVPEGLLQRLGMAEGAVRIANPLNAERAAMRTTLLAGLLENLKRAVTRYEPGIRQFEVGRTFHDEGGELPREVLRVAALLAGPRDAWVGEAAAEHDFFDIKGLVLAIVRDISGEVAELRPTSAISCLHPARACEVVVGGVSIGVMGELHPEVLSAMKLSRGAVCCELEVLALWEKRKRSRVEALSEFPPMSRDVAFLVAEREDAGPIAAALKASCGPLAVGVRLFDVYRGKEIEDGKKSLAYSVAYRALDRTLTDAEIDGIHRDAVADVARRFNAVVR